MKSLATGAFFLLIMWGFLGHAAYAIDIKGIIDADTRWTADDSPVNVTGNVRVAEGVVLTIDPGVEVVFQSSPNLDEGYSLRIFGTLTARGSDTNPIIFTAEDVSVPWGAIEFSDTSQDWNSDTAEGCVIEYCVVEHGGNETDGRGMIRTVDAEPRIVRNAIRFSTAAGISAQVAADPAEVVSPSGNLQILDNLIYSNATGIRSAAEGGRIENNFFLNNARAIDLQVRSNDVSLHNNTVYSNAPELLGTGVRLELDEKGSGIDAYQWVQTQGTNVTLSSSQSAGPSFVAPDPGNREETLAFELTVTGAQGRQDTDLVEITVIGDNPPPVADAGGDRNIALPEDAGDEVTVTLSAAGSRAAYLGIAGYAWEQTEGPSVSLAGANTIAPEFTVPASVSAGDRMTFELTVTDQSGLTATDTVDIRFYQDNIYPAANAGEDRTVSQAAEVMLDASGSSDPDGSITAYDWQQTEGPSVDLVNSNTARPFFFAPLTDQESVNLEFRVEVTDNGGLQDTDGVEITVNSGVIAQAGESRTVSAGDRVVLDGSASVDRAAAANILMDGNLMTFENANAGLIALSAVAESAFQLDVSGNRFKAAEDEGYIVYTYDWADEAPESISMPDNEWGTEDFIAIDELIYDSSDDYTLPTIDFQPLAAGGVTGVGSSLAYPPLANAGPDLETNPDSTVTLDGSGSYDPDNIASYRWEQLEGPAVDIESSDQAVAEFVAPAGGSEGTRLQFGLTVSTGPVFSHTDTVNVDVSPDADLPETDADSCFIRSLGGGHGSSGLVLGVCLITGLLGLLGCRTVGRHRRNFFYGILLGAVVLLSAVPARAGYFAVGGGAGGDAEEINVSVETGAKDLRAGGLDFMFGLGLHLIPHSEDELPSGTIDQPCPNDACLPLGSERKGTEVGLFGKLGVEIASTDFYVSAIGGFTTYTESELSRSPSTGRVYEDSSDTQVDPLYGGGISYFFDFQWDIVLHVDYDNVRGVTGSIGWHW